jgi:adsorption protein B
LLLALAYLLIAVTGCHLAFVAAGVVPPIELGAELQVLLTANLAFLVWRAASRAAFTAREFGWEEGLRAVLRIPVSNVIAIMAGRRALVAYCRSLAGEAPRWDKTEHDLHPTTHQPMRKAA